MILLAESAAAGQSAVVTMAATEHLQHEIDWIDASYSGVGSGMLTVEDVDGEGVIYKTDITGGPHPIDRHLVGTRGKELRVTLSGIALLKGKLDVGASNNSDV